MVLLALGVLGLAYWFISTSLTPVTVPQQLVIRSAVRFDPKLDISSNEKFLVLRPLGEFELSLPKMGRENPFSPPVLTTQDATSTATTSEMIYAFAVTSTATTTESGVPQNQAGSAAFEAVTGTEF